MVSSPLILSHDLSDDTAYDAAWPIISNQEALRINAQHFHGDLGRLVAVSDDNLTDVTVYHGARCECVWGGQQLPRWTVWAKRLNEDEDVLPYL